jgi:hypothetical protein
MNDKMRDTLQVIYHEVTTDVDGISRDEALAVIGNVRELARPYAPVLVPPPVVLPLNTALDTLKDWLQGRFDRGKRVGMRRTIPTTPPNLEVTTPCWTWMGTVSRGRSNTPPRPKGKPPACEATKHVQSIVLLRKYGWADMKGNIKVKLNCGNQLCCNPDHLAAGEQVVTVA